MEEMIKIERKKELEVAEVVLTTKKKNLSKDQNYYSITNNQHLIQT